MDREMIAEESSEAEFSAEARSLNVVIDVLMGNWVLDDFLDAEGSIAGGVKVPGPTVEGSLLSSPLVDFVDLNSTVHTTLFLSTSLMLTICPKEGTTLMLMLLNERGGTRPQRWSFGMTFVLI